MGTTTKISWCDSTWNPVTGCYNGCEYCYARRIATRFEAKRPCAYYDGHLYMNPDCEHPLHMLDGPAVSAIYTERNEKHDLRKDYMKQPYPFGFEPTFHRYKLDEPQKWKKPRHIFVCSMADLFADWIPQNWIRQVMDACYAAPQHSYLFLTKNPKRYTEVIDYLETGVKDSPTGKPPAMWFGATATNNEQLESADDTPATWVSIEPIHERIWTDANFAAETNCGFGYREFGRWLWVVIGAETGHRNGKVVPEKEWVKDISEECRHWETPVFMKESLRELMGEDFRQEFPWEVEP